MRQRQHGKHAEPPGVIAHHLLHPFVRLARNARCRLRVAVQEVHLRRGRRHDRGRDAGRLHVVERFLHRPVDNGRIVEPGLLDGVEPGRRRDVVMHVDAMGLGLRERRRRHLHERVEAEHGGAAGNESSPAQSIARGAARERAGAMAGEQVLRHAILPDGLCLILRRPWRRRRSSVKVAPCCAIVRHSGAVAGARHASPLPLTRPLARSAVPAYHRRPM